MKKVYYFTYGSNILQERLEQRVGAVKKISNHRLMGYKLVFDTGMGSGYGCAAAGGTGLYANIIPGEPTDFVEGVLYDLTPEQLKRLDGYEILYCKEFFIAPDGNIAAVYTNNDAFQKEEGLPALYYLNIILEGCVEQGLDHTLEMLQQYKKDNFKLKSYKKFVKVEKVQTRKNR